MAEAVAFSGSDTTDPRILCPNTGRICVARETVVTLFDTHVDEQFAASMPENEFNPRFDQKKLSIRLAEYDVRAKLVDCGNTPADVCPVRASMDESQIRIGIVKTLRKALGRER